MKFSDLQSEESTMQAVLAQELLTTPSSQPPPISTKKMSCPEVWVQIF